MAELKNSNDVYCSGFAIVVDNRNFFAGLLYFMGEFSFYFSYLGLGCHLMFQFSFHFMHDHVNECGFQCC